MTCKLLLNIVFAAVTFLGFSEAWATVTIQVNSTADEIDDNLTDGVCHTASGVCTLRAAIMTANRETFDTQINLPAGTYTLSIPSSSDDEGTGDLDLTTPIPGTSPEIDIDGSGMDSTIIDGGRVTRVFDIDNQRQAHFYRLTIRNGVSTGNSGGGIINFGLLTLTDVAVTGNTAAAGGGIFNEGQLYLQSSIVTGNVAAQFGGGIENDGFVFLGTTVVRANISGVEAGGIGNFSGAEMSFQDSTIVSNTASTEGGGIWNYGMAC